MTWGALLAVAIWAASGGPAGGSGAPVTAASEGAASKRAVAESAKEATPRQASPSEAEQVAKIDELRKQCYGGRQRELPRIAQEQLIAQARTGVMNHDLDRVVEAVRRLLQGGGDESRFIPTLGMALEERSNDPHQRWVAKRCHELLRALGTETSD